MNEPFYEFRVLDEACRFDFLSIGKRNIPKTVIYYKSDNPAVFSLTLASIKSDGNLDFQTTSNNGDMKIILATVVQTLKIFLAAYPKAVVVFTGNSPSRTRLYNIIISREIEQVKDYLEVMGFAENYVELFVPNRRYEGFIVSLKNSFT
ncbi:hypothetical protein MUK70_18315 [Dyadobacter chenwenxiniae]|uniref:Uncharacterized protein n=1 Tax=Dyadobacter chenwenxiniae TaxID=2906456 RepID=A0A9X1TDJ8_9BACT|nr:hypothetical protein [Dyadobacter chenwenxiniae]MCF0061197.1 hypothetical protein [Dyadobacter chenwenxiniae]UON81021.1 hypothetical protein MUK70_18315 [Dyadobacter chenwenxiniae]